MGITAQIRESLLNDGPQTAGDISRRLAISIADAYAYLWQMTYRTKELVIVSRKPSTFAMLEARREKWRGEKYHGQPAGKITVGRGAKWGNRVGGQLA